MSTTWQTGSTSSLQNVNFVFYSRYTNTLSTLSLSICDAGVAVLAESLWCVQLLWLFVREIFSSSSSFGMLQAQHFRLQVGSIQSAK